MSTSIHGANLFDLAESLNCEISDFKDFSSNINPFAPSQKTIDALKNNVDKISIYPDHNYKNLKSSIQKYCNCDIDDILLGCGASSFITSFIQVLAPKKALVFSPAYAEYTKELQKKDSQIFEYVLHPENNFSIIIDELINMVKKNSIDTVVFCNPNNPTGTIVSNSEIEELLNATDINLIIDETYIEFTDKSKYSCESICKNYDRLFIIRSTSKFFACPGLRLGYSLTSNKDVKYKLEHDFNILWDINIFADIAGQEMFNDYEFQKESYNKITTQRDYLIENLSKISSLQVFNSYGNFILMKILDEKINASYIYDYLLKQGLIIRNCGSFKELGENYFRVCILEEENNKTLIKFLNKIFDIV